MDVDAYIANAPKEARDKLKELRPVIKQIAPDAIEMLDAFSAELEAWKAAAVGADYG